MKADNGLSETILQIFLIDDLICDCSRINFAYTYIKNNFRNKVILEDIAHTSKMLTENLNPVSEICFSCGYENIVIFKRQFKSLTNITPMS
ncbi:MAG: helix-turn-helix transcriptional regulator [Bacteroidales bacterium]|nr:helix-turn-helix transcriptional regulator [Bacteroidales bacterium]